MIVLHKLGKLTVQRSCLKMPSPKEESHGGDTSSGKKMDSSTSSSVDKKASPAGSRTPERPPSDGSPVSDDTCPICLGHISDKCVANSCLHSFCLVCLKEWSKQKAVCPLCKLSFTTIMYDIQSETKYKEWKVPRSDPAERSQRIANFQQFLDAERRRFFGYRTTNFPGAATLRRQHPGRPHAIPDAIPSGPRERRSARYNLRGTSMFRLSVYLNNVWVQPIADITGRYRQSSPQLYREQPALTHRLVPWVNRELTALLPSSRIGVVLAEVMELIERYSIDSHEFRQAMQPHLGRRTNHFVHEFYHFARSPYDMVGHDNAAQYVPRYGFNDEDSSSSSSDDSDAVVEVDLRGNPVLASTGVEVWQGSTAPGNVVREETLTQEGSVVISSNNSSSSEIDETPQLSSIQPEAGQSSQHDFSETHNPEPPAVHTMRRLLGRARDFLSTINEGASTSRSEGSSGMPSSASGAVKNEIPSEGNDTDECIIIEEVKKKTPEIINLDSEDDVDESKTSKKIDQPKKNQDTSSCRQEKIKKRPSLKRTNFPLRTSQPSCSGSSNTKSAKEDHSYCSERDSVNIEASTSSTCTGSVPTSSTEISLKQSKTSENHDSGVKVKKKERHNSSSSDDESSLKSYESKKRKHKDREKEKYERSSGKSKHMDRSRADTYGPSSSRHRIKFPSRERNSSPKRLKKDHKSKIKSSSTRSSSRHNTYERYSYTCHYVSESSNDTWCNSDSLWTPPSSKTEGSWSQNWDSIQSRESSCDSKDSCYREWRGDHCSSKSRHSSKKRKRKSREKRKNEKSKKSKKRIHKKKGKSKKSSYKSSKLQSDSDSSEKIRIKRSKRRKNRIIDSLRSSSDSSDFEQRKRTKITLRISDISSSSHSSSSLHSSSSSPTSSSSSCSSSSCDDS